VSRDDLDQGTVWVIMDITRRKELEEQLHHTMSEREAILNNAVVGIVLSVKRRHEWVNEKFAQMLGYPRQVLIGLGSDYLHPDRESWERFGVEARTGADRHQLLHLRAAGCAGATASCSGSRWAAVACGPTTPDAGVIWTFLDITGRKKSDAEMREALEQQKVLNELRSRFVAMTSHEFRTPLAAILTAVELLRHYGDRLPAEERRETLDGIATGVQRMSRMLDRVLLLGKAEAQMLDFKPQDLDVRALCPQLVDEARRSTRKAPRGGVRVAPECRPASTTRSCCGTSSATCCPTRSSTRRTAARCASRCGARARTPCSAWPTRASAFPPTSSATCSNRSTAPATSARSRAPGWAWRS
jgi:hypothetical protein